MYIQSYENYSVKKNENTILDNFHCLIIISSFTVG